MAIVFDFSPYFSSPEALASKVLEIYFKTEKPSYPIDPFKLLNEFDVIFQFRDFKDLEGIYLVPEDQNDIPIVGININRPIYRQRFTAAHELCHHIKDKDESICPINGRQKSPRETFADRFASALLMPKKDLYAIACTYIEAGYVSLDSALTISDYFGVSFESCIFTLAYQFNMINGDINADKLKKRIRKYKPDTQRLSLNLRKYDPILVKNIIDSYSYFFDIGNNVIWYRFKNDFIYNENKIEGNNIEHEDVAEILADLRMKKQDSVYCKSEYKEIIEVAGHASMYDYMIETNDDISGYKMLNLNKMLFQYAPYPELAGGTRTNNNFVISAKFETVDWHMVPKEIVNIDDAIKSLLNVKDELSVSQYIDEVIKIHHKITVVHPFADGNGRVSRVMLNWLFKIKKLPPVYLKYDRKEKYYDALKKADLDGDHTDLSEVFYREILYSMIQLNTKFLI